MAPIKAQSGLRQRIVSLKSLGKLLTQCKLEKKIDFSKIKSLCFKN